MTQYSDSYGTVSSSYLSYFQNHIGALDNAIAFRTGDKEYSCLVQSPNGQVEKIVITTNNSYGGSIQSTVTAVDSFDYTITNEYYVYSNFGVGQRLGGYDRMTTVIAFGVFMALLLMIFSRVVQIFKRRLG